MIERKIDRAYVRRSTRVLSGLTVALFRGVEGILGIIIISRGDLVILNPAPRPYTLSSSPYIIDPLATPLDLGYLGTNSLYPRP